MSKRNCLINKRFSDDFTVLVRRGTIFQSLASCTTLAHWNSGVPHPISLPIALLEIFDLSLAFRTIDR